MHERIRQPDIGVELEVAVGREQRARVATLPPSDLEVVLERSRADEVDVTIGFPVPAAVEHWMRIEIERSASLEEVFQGGHAGGKRFGQLRRVPRGIEHRTWIKARCGSDGKVMLDR